ncbi:hypothetical protein ANO14919_140070 [Xylariales sp. No.14919]|nr:hypothetical protein ANO14919_140070 [Xylariales sp. No.14919]
MSATQTRPGLTTDSTIDFETAFFGDNKRHEQRANCIIKNENFNCRAADVPAWTSQRQHPINHDFHYLGLLYANMTVTDREIPRQASKQSGSLTFLPLLPIHYGTIIFTPQAFSLSDVATSTIVECLEFRASFLHQFN